MPATEPFTPTVVEREADFWRLIWQSVDLLRFLTPVGRCRTLRCVVDRLNSYHVTIDELAASDARPDITRYTDWFVSCVHIALSFDWNRFEVKVRPMTRSSSGCLTLWSDRSVQTARGT